MHGCMLRDKQESLFQSPSPMHPRSHLGAPGLVQVLAQQVQLVARVGQLLVQLAAGIEIWGLVESEWVLGWR
jgi:hypothetical protein